MSVYRLFNCKILHREMHPRKRLVSISFGQGSTVCSLRRSAASITGSSADAEGHAWPRMLAFKYGLISPGQAMR